MKHGSPVQFVRFTADGRRLLCECEDRTARLWNGETGEPVGELLARDEEFREWSFSPDGRWLAGRYPSGFIRLWDLGTGRPVGKAMRHGSAHISLEFSPDGRWMATIGDDRDALLWECATGEPVAGKLRHDSQVFGCSFQAGGTRLLTGTMETTHLWDVAFLQGAVTPRSFLEEARVRTGHRLGPQDEVEVVPAGEWRPQRSAK